MPKKIISVHTSEKATSDYNKKLQGFQEIQNRIKKYDDSLTPVNDQPQMSLNVYLSQQGITPTFAVKSAYAKKTGFNNYIGSKEQDDMIMMSIQGQDNNKSMKEQSEKDYGLKEREMSIKEKQIENSKAPTAEDVASSILKAYKNQ